MQSVSIDQNKLVIGFRHSTILEVLAMAFSGLAAFASASMAGETTSFDWPQFHGPNRDNISCETGLLPEWPPDGPQLLWTADGLGEGFSTVSIKDGLIYTTGNIQDHTVITALTDTGEPAWTARNGSAYRREQPGTRSTPTIDGSRLYHLNADGDLVCLDAKTGEQIWALNVLERFNGRNIRWALAESPLIDGNRLICIPGGENAGIVALDKRSGKTIWVCETVNDKPGYASPIIFEYKGLRQIVALMAKSVVGLNADTGNMLWELEHHTPFDENINTPIYHDGSVFICSRTTGTRRLRLSVDEERVTAEQVWESQRLDSQHGGILRLDGYLYGACRLARSGPWVCLDAKTGACMYAEEGIGPGSMTYADGRLYALNHRGTVALVRPNSRDFNIVSQFDIPDGGRGPTWAHPVVCNGRLHIRHGDFLYCYDVAKARR